MNCAQIQVILAISMHQSVYATLSMLVPVARWIAQIIGKVTATKNIIEKIFEDTYKNTVIF